MIHAEVSLCGSLIEMRTHARTLCACCWLTGADWRERRQGSLEEGADKFWRTIFGGAASARHHRNEPREGWGGIGLSPFGQTQMRSMRMLLDSMSGKANGGRKRKSPPERHTS